MLTWLYSVMDSCFCRGVTDPVVQQNFNDAAKYHKLDAVQEMQIEFNALDSKAGVLIGHLSLMVATVAILHASSTYTLFRVIFGAELIFYLFTLIIVIRVIHYMFYEEVHPKGEFELMRELTKRGIYFRLAHVLTNLGTIALIFTIAPALMIGIGR